jgi:hypothetical protein
VTWLLYEFLSLKADVNKSNKPLTKRAGSRSVSQWYGSADSDPYQNVTDPHHCLWPCCCGAGMTPLLAASVTGHLHIVEYLIGKSPLTIVRPVRLNRPRLGLALRLGHSSSYRF